LGLADLRQIQEGAPADQQPHSPSQRTKNRREKS
jgi:hypothetical protein